MVKELGKNKIFLICLAVCLLFIILFIFFLFYKDTKVLKENNYTTYITREDDNLLKLEFKESYYECDNEICSDINRVVVSFEVLDDLNVDVDFTELDIITAIEMFINGMEESNLVIVSNYEFSEEDIAQIKGNANENIKVVYEDSLDNFEEVVYYTITFDTVGGSSIDSVVVAHGNSVAKPIDPTRNGYTFAGWFHNDQAYDFSSAVTSDLTLVAKWEEVEDTNSSSVSSNNQNKININSNLSATIYTKSTGSIGCFYYVYATNLESIYPNASYDRWSNGITGITLCPGMRENCLDSEFILDDFNDSRIVYDTNKENALRNTFAKYDNTPGFNLVFFNNDNHKISFEYEYITFNGLDVADGTKAYEEIQELLQGAYYIQGPCGGFNALENVTVDADICNRFNLDCE